MTIENIFAAVAADSSLSLLLNGSQVRLYSNSRGEWCLGNYNTGDHYLSTLFDNFQWTNDILFFDYKGEEMDLQVVKVLDFTQFRTSDKQNRDIIRS